jgi:homoserine O-acetyltransferase
MLFKPLEMEEIYNTMISIGKEDIVTYRMIDSDYGHDAFLLEVDKFEEQIKKILKD